MKVISIASIFWVLGRTINKLHFKFSDHFWFNDVKRVDGNWPPPLVQCPFMWISIYVLKLQFKFAQYIIQPWPVCFQVLKWFLHMNTFMGVS